MVDTIHDIEEEKPILALCKGHWFYQKKKKAIGFEVHQALDNIVMTLLHLHISWMAHGPHFVRSFQITQSC